MDRDLGEIGIAVMLSLPLNTPPQVRVVVDTYVYGYACGEAWFHRGGFAAVLCLLHTVLHSFHGNQIFADRLSKLLRSQWLQIMVCPKFTRRTCKKKMLSAESFRTTAKDTCYEKLM